MTAFPLEEGDTGEALLPDLLKRARDAAIAEAAVASEPELRPAQSGLPEYLDKLRADRESLEWSLAYWEWLAKYGRRKRIWRSGGWDHWGLKWYAGGDEFGRHTVVVGPWVIALWSCRCDDCKADEAALLAIIDGDIEEDGS